MDENMQPESLPLQEVKQSEPHLVQEPKAPKQNFTIIILAVLLAILLITVAGLGFWTYQLNSNLASTQQKLTTLQNEHTKLQSDYEKIKNANEKLTADLNQTKSDLEKTNGDLTIVQADLKKSQDQNKGFQEKIALTSKKAEILYAFSTVKSGADVLAIDTLIKATNDQQLLTQWNSFFSSPSTDNSVKFLLYLIGSIQDELK